MKITRRAGQGSLKLTVSLEGPEMKLFDFIKNEDGAVTVDWVVLTAAIVGLGVVVITSVGVGVEQLSENISTEVGDTTVTARPASK